MKKESLKYNEKVFKALSAYVRLEIIEYLGSGEKTVGDIADFIKRDISTVSKHLSTLKNAELIDYRKNGKHVFYFITKRCVISFIDCISSSCGGDGC